MIQLLKLDQTPIWVKYEYRTYLSIFVSKNAWSECKAWKQNPFWSEKPISSILYSVASDCLKPFLSWNTPFLFSSSKSLSHYRYIIPVFSIISECATFFTSNLWCSIGSLPHAASICMGKSLSFVTCFTINHASYTETLDLRRIRSDVNPLDSRVPYGGFLKWCFTPISHPKMIIFSRKSHGLLGKPTILGTHILDNIFVAHLCQMALQNDVWKQLLVTWIKLLDVCFFCRSSIQTRGLATTVYS